ncbi:MAG: aldehyde dehydrogenase [Acetobacteraceae bacterium]|nr:aldehyde dehydrogenase [Acetobacteraceae bacterium]
MTVQTLASTTAAAKPYEDFDRLPIGGSWREGRSDKVLPDRNPYTGSVLVQIRQGNREDLDTAFETAAEAHKDWAARLPSPRAEAIRRAAAIFQARRGEVVSWLIREVGSRPISNGRPPTRSWPGVRAPPTSWKARTCPRTSAAMRARSTVSQFASLA